MKIEINRIKVTERIRKEVIKIDELALDIVENGLLNPVTVMALPNITVIKYTPLQVVVWEKPYKGMMLATPKGVVSQA